MVYNMLPVHPETRHSNEQQVRAAKSQEVGSRQKIWYWRATPRFKTATTTSMTEKNDRNAARIWSIFWIMTWKATENGNRLMCLRLRVTLNLQIIIKGADSSPVLWNNHRLLRYGRYLFTSLKKHHKNEVWPRILGSFLWVFSLWM